jgi:hypothetical protein
MMSGDVVRSGHGGHRPALKGTADFSLSLRLNGGRLFSDQGQRLEDTPSRGKLLKESLDFSIIKPAVLKHLLRIRFLLWKT